jgi:hypothetical protein
MASIAGQPRFGIFEITPVGLAVALAGGLYLFLFSGRLLARHGVSAQPADDGTAIVGLDEPGLAGSQLGHAAAFVEDRPLQPWRAAASAAVFLA